MLKSNTVLNHFKWFSWILCRVFKKCFKNPRIKFCSFRDHQIYVE